jgi:hypothetical protein
VSKIPTIYYLGVSAGRRIEKWEHQSQAGLRKRDRLFTSFLSILPL